MSETTGTKRPVLATGVIILHLLLALVLIALAGYALSMTRSPEVLREPDAADAIRGLKMGAAALAAPGLMLLVGVVGLWNRKFWGWCLTLIVSVGIEAALVYNLLEDGWRDVERDDAIIAAVFLIFPLLLLLPHVRRYCRTPPPR